MWPSMRWLMCLSTKILLMKRMLTARFKANFAKFSLISGPVFASAIVNRRSYLRDYAFTNLQEFWAVSVEAFFENPSGLKQSLPQLYGTLCDILNQDPLTGDKILIK